MEPTRHFQRPAQNALYKNSAQREAPETDVPCNRQGEGLDPAYRQSKVEINYTITP